MTELRRLTARTDFAEPNGAEHLVALQENELARVNDEQLEQLLRTFLAAASPTGSRQPH